MKKLSYKQKDVLRELATILFITALIILTNPIAHAFYPQTENIPYSLETSIFILTLAIIMLTLSFL